MSRKMKGSKEANRRSKSRLEAVAKQGGNVRRIKRANSADIEGENRKREQGAMDGPL